jgi:DNA-binding CsgD family transcriptional regulator
MTLTLQDLAWHRDIGQLIEALDSGAFWPRLVRQLGHYLVFDSWVVLLFGPGRPQVLAESPGEDGGEDPLFRDYLKGLYLLDPFYLSARESPASGLFQLSDIAPECFEQTDYYQRYFRLNVVADEVQINVQLDSDRVLCLSLGAHRCFTREDIALLDMLRPWVSALMRQRLHFEHPREATPVEPHWQDRLVGHPRLQEAQLTSRELDVARLMLSGCSGKEIARKLSISTETVKVHRRHLYAKLGLKSQSELFSLFLNAQES